jgi:hypothetical protein
MVKSEHKLSEINKSLAYDEYFIVDFDYLSEQLDSPVSTISRDFRLFKKLNIIDTIKLNYELYVAINTDKINCNTVHFFHYDPFTKYKSKILSQIDFDPLIAPETIPVKKSRGIYFLYNCGELVYIGKSENIFSRVGTHLNDKKFDSYIIKELPDISEDELSITENELIRKYNPQYNIQEN